MAYHEPTSSAARRAGIWVIAIAALGLGMWGLAQISTSSNGPSIAPPDVAQVAATDHVKGTTGPILIEYSDFQCPACKSFEPVVQQLLKDSGDRMTFVYRHYPLRSIHANAQLAAQAAEAAHKQGKFWEMHGRLFQGQNSWAEDRNPEGVFETYAKDLGLNVEQFKSDLKSSEVRDRVNADATSGERASINSTPTFFLNGQRLNLQSYDDLRTSVNNAINAQQ